MASDNKELPKIQRGMLIPKERPTADIADARHQAMMDAIAPFAKKTIQKNLTPVYVDYKTRKTKMVLVLCPEWSPYMPPFSLAKLSGIAKAAGYETNIIDLNVRAYNLHNNDWIPNNKRNGYIRELSYLIAGQETRLTRTKINLRNWYRNLTIDRIQIPYLNPQEKQTLLFQLKKEGGAYGSKNVSVSYVPVFELLQSPRLRQRIPTGSLIFFVGHDSYLSSRIGTSMNVLHMSFAIWNNGQLYCRMASSKAGKVLDVLFPDYLKTYLSLGTLDGISVWSITEQT